MLKYNKELYRPSFKKHPFLNDVFLFFNGHPTSLCRESDFSREKFAFKRGVDAQWLFTKK